MKITFYNLACTLLVAFAMISCTKTDAIDNLKQEHGQYQSILKFKVAKSVRSVPAEDEVKRIDIFLFKDNILERSILNITSFDTTEDGYGSVIVGSDEKGVRKAFIVANIDDPALFAMLKPGVSTVDDMQNIRTSLLLKMANPPLVMHGICETITFSDITATVSFKFNRVAARIDVNNIAKNFVLTGARLINSKEASFIFSGKESSGIPVKDLEVIEAADSKVTLYTYENAQINGDNSTSVEITGTVNGAPLTYNVKLIDDTENFPLQRGYQYTIDVNNVQQNNVTIKISVRPWLIGEDVIETVDGTIPVIAPAIDPLIGVYNSQTKHIDATATGGTVTFEAQANAECGIDVAEAWVKLLPDTRSSSIKTAFVVNIEANTQPAARTTTIRFFNKINDKSESITLTQAPVAIEEDKYMVLVVAGQSNAVGYDESAVLPESTHKPNPRAFQLSYRYGAKNPSITQLEWCSENLQDMRTATNASGLKGAKGIHLPLANELLKHIPSDYKLLIIPVAYGGTSLLTANNPSMQYNAVTMQPAIMNATLQWGVGRPYNRTMIDRVKFVLNENPENKFLGVVWCQGENDAKNSEAHYAAFNTMTQDFFNQINTAGYGSRCPKGVADKNLWYNYSSTKYWSDWYLTNSNSSGVFGGYKVWNPNTFIHVPFDTDTNEINGNGSTSSTRASHFGNNAFSSVIAPMVVECMDNNGGLFNGNTPKNDRFVETDIKANAGSIGGSLDDTDLRQGLRAFYPLNGNSISLISTPFSARQTSSALYTPATGLVDINGKPRTQTAFKVSPTSRIRVTGEANTGDWTIAFMFKRTGGQTNAQQAIIAGTSATPFIGFKKYPNNGGAGTYAEFVVEPIPGTDPLKAVAGQFMDADHVRTQDDWVHYVITYKAASKSTMVYMNGQMVGAKSIASVPALNMNYVDVGVTTNCALGEIFNLGIWNNVLNATSVKKLYLYSYYGFTK